ncbi:MAG: hypothetical protein RJA41_726 [Actinomycetota bacterium]|jgi:hypothetical protein
MNADVMVNIHNALYSPTRIARIGRESLIIEELDDNVNCFRRTFYGPFAFATQNLRKDSPNTAWIQESPQTRQITWLHPRHSGGFAGKIVSSQDNDELFLHVVRFYPNNKTHELIKQSFRMS